MFVEYSGSGKLPLISVYLNLGFADAIWRMSGKLPQYWSRAGCRDGVMIGMAWSNNPIYKGPSTTSWDLTSLSVTEDTGYSRQKHTLRYCGQTQMRDTEEGDSLQRLPINREEGRLPIKWGTTPPTKWGTTPPTKWEWEARFTKNRGSQRKRLIHRRGYNTVLHSPAKRGYNTSYILQREEEF